MQNTLHTFSATLLFVEQKPRVSPMPPFTNSPTPPTHLLSCFSFQFETCLPPEREEEEESSAQDAGRIRAAGTFGYPDKRICNRGSLFDCEELTSFRRTIWDIYRSFFRPTRHSGATPVTCTTSPSPKFHSSSPPTYTSMSCPTVATSSAGPPHSSNPVRDHP